MPDYTPMKYKEARKRTDRAVFRGLGSILKAMLKRRTVSAQPQQRCQESSRTFPAPAMKRPVPPVSITSSLLRDVRTVVFFLGCGFVGLTVLSIVSIIVLTILGQSDRTASPPGIASNPGPAPIPASASEIPLEVNTPSTSPVPVPTPAPDPAKSSSSFSFQPTDSQSVLLDYARKQFGITSLRVEGPSIFVEFPPEKYARATARADLTEAARTIARKWSEISGRGYVNCHVYKGKEEFTNGIKAQ
ncbi:MAG: hypothetical protein ACAI35_17940 [Candidatus Methylacidiphilales bacterium]|nr:hypothetical protein [Candidatus Methylacidiphilales bacterium]